MPTYSIRVGYRIEGTTPGHEWHAPDGGSGFKSGDTYGTLTYPQLPGYHVTRYEIVSGKTSDFISISNISLKAKFTDHSISVMIWYEPNPGSTPGPKDPDDLWEDPGGGGDNDDDGPGTVQPTQPPDLPYNTPTPTPTPTPKPTPTPAPTPTDDPFKDNVDPPATDPIPVQSQVTSPDTSDPPTPSEGNSGFISRPPRP